MTESGLDIDEEILVRLEVNDLIRCKSVCKSWNSLISSYRFVKSHLKRHSNEIGQTRIVVSSLAIMCVDEDGCLSVTDGMFKLVGSSNGLVCISYFNTDFLVVNPSTREVKELRNPPQHSHVSGFGYDSSTDDFKVVIGYKNEHGYVFKVLNLKTNIWRSVVVEFGGLFYGYLSGNGILCDGAIHWRGDSVIVSFDLSKEVFKEIPLPKLDEGDWYLGTMKDRLCILHRPGYKENNTKIWIMRKYNVQDSWEQKLPPRGYDAHKPTMDYFPPKDLFNGIVHIWLLLEEGSCGPVLVGSIERPDWDIPHRNSDIRLTTNPECNYNYNEHVFVKSLVSPHGNGSCKVERVKRKGQNVISPDGDGRSSKSRRESPVSHNYEGGRGKRTKQSLFFLCADCDGDWRRVERKRRERESHVFEWVNLVVHSSDKGRAKIKRKSLVSSDSDDNGRRVERKRRERERESLAATISLKLSYVLSMTTKLGLDIHEEILLRLQVNDLIRCKSVCKLWNSLISSDRFVKSQLKRRHSDECGDTTRIIVFDGASSMCQLIGSSNGLVCISSYHTGFLVVNPSTREVKQLTNPPPQGYNRWSYVSGFGYDSSIDDFKVVIGHWCNPNNDCLMFYVLELKTNIWRSVVVEWDYEYLNGNGILCNEAIHWLHQDIHNFVIVSFDLSKEVFKKKPLPKLDDEWNLGTMKDRLCVFRFPNTDLKENDDEIEIWVMRNDQVSWERKSLPPGYDANKTTMNYIPHRNLFSTNLVHIWLLEQGSGAPVLVRSIDHPDNRYIDDHDNIRLSTYSECNYNFDEHVFVKSLVSPHGMGNENGSCNERVKRKRQNVISPDGDGRSVKSRRESPVSHNSDGGRAKKTMQSLLLHDADCDGDGRRVERKRRERESHVFHSSDGGRAKSKRQSHVSSDSDDDGRRVEGKRRERESLVFHTSDKGRAKIHRQSLVSFDSDDDGRRVERKRRESHVFHSSDKGRAKIKRQSLVSSDSDDDGRRVERKRRERDRESLVFHSSDRGRAKSKRESHVSSNSDGDGRRGERKRRERESPVFHSSDGGRAKSKRHQSLVSYDSDGDGRRVDRKRREKDRESLVFHNRYEKDGEESHSEREMTMAMRGDTIKKGRN